MKRFILAALLALLFAPSEAPAQYFQYVYRNTPYGRAYAYRQQYGPFVIGTSGFTPYFAGLPYWQNAYAGFPYSNFNSPYYPFFGYPTYQFPAYQQSAPVIVQQPIIIQAAQQPQNNGFPPQNFNVNNPIAGNGFGNGFGGNGFGNGFGGNGFGNGFGGGMNNGLMPAKFGDAPAIPAEKPLPKVELPKVGPAPKVVEAPVAPAPKLEMPKPAEKLNGAELARRSIEAGKTAFSNGEFGRAVELFRNAVNQNGHDPLGYFLLAEGQFSIGKYREAVASISAGMTLKGDWSSAKFDPRKLYGKEQQLFDEHVKQLRAALVEYRDDPTLSFLLGHQLWFDGKKDEAKPYLMKAKTGPRGASPADLFLIPEGK